MNESTVNLFIGMVAGVVISLVVFIARKDFLQHQCDNKLIKENKPRNFVCKVRMKAVIVNKLEQEVNK
jgi:hypothetical protein